MKPIMEIKTQYLNLCRGVGLPGCMHANDVSTDFEKRIEQVVQNSGWPKFLHDFYGGKINRHHGFQIHVSACPNGCSRPHIADIGFIRACEPQVAAEACISCGNCAEACPDEAIAMVDGLPAINRDACISCGRCVLVCPVDSMHCTRAGWRVLAGGRLGRHPQLARELDGLHDDDTALTILDRALQLFMANYTPRKRFGAIMDELGYDTLLQRGK
jgi:dissimilatory sulfite reductase (desulfoviridin) alpha/beta subunit